MLRLEFNTFNWTIDVCGSVWVYNVEILYEPRVEMLDNHKNWRYRRKHEILIYYIEDNIY